MKELIPIYQLLEEERIEYAIQVLRDLIADRKVSTEASNLLVPIETTYSKAKRDFRLGLITETTWEHEQQQAIQDLQELLDELKDLPPPRNQPTTTPPTKKKGGGILGRALEALWKYWPNTTKSIPSRPPSPRIPGTGYPDRIPENGGPPMTSGSEPPEETAPPPSPAPVSVPVPVPKPSPTQVGTSGVKSPFQAGKILYVIPPNMQLAETTRCRVRISPEELDDTLMASGLSEEEKQNAKREGLQITSVIKVELEEAKPENSLEIVARNTAEQPILPFMPTEWSFDVTPRRPGHHVLLLRVTAKVQIPNFGERGFDVAALNRAILVTTTGEAVDEATFNTQPIPDPTWDEADEALVHQALILGRVDLAIERIVNFVQDKDTDFRDTLLLLLFRWNDNSNHLEQKVISASDWDKVNNQVRLAITKLLAELRTHFATPETTEAMDWKTANSRLKEEGF